MDDERREIKIGSQQIVKSFRVSSKYIVIHQHCYKRPINSGLKLSMIVAEKISFRYAKRTYKNFNGVWNP